MQLASTYLVSNKTVVVVDGFVAGQEYRKVYQRNITVAKGIDNLITFELKNSDHKPLSILNTYTPYVEVYTEDNTLLKKYMGTIKETSTPNYKGVFTINITDNDTLNIDGQYMSYTVYLEKASDNSNVLTYADTQFGVRGIIELTDEAFPGPIASKATTTFMNNISSTFNGQPEINSNTALHTAVFYTTTYKGDVVVQGTLDDVAASTWFDIDTVTMSTPTTPTYVNFNGVFSHVRFKRVDDSTNTGSIDKILLRN